MLAAAGALASPERSGSTVTDTRLRDGLISPRAELAGLIRPTGSPNPSVSPPAEGVEAPADLDESAFNQRHHTACTSANWRLARMAPRQSLISPGPRFECLLTGNHSEGSAVRVWPKADVCQCRQHTNRSRCMRAQLAPDLPRQNHTDRLRARVKNDVSLATTQLS